MKHYLTTAALALLFAASMPAATIVDSFDEGKGKAGDDGFVVIVYPEGWNAKDEKMAKAILKSPELAKAAGGAMLMGVGLPNTSNKEQTEARKKRIGKLQLPNAGSYPAIYMCDKEGYNYAVINSNDYRDVSLPPKKMTKDAIPRASKEVANRLAAIKKRRDLMSKAYNASGKEGLDLVYQACNVPGVNRPGDAVNVVKRLDPKNESGLLPALNHNTYGFIEGCGNAKDWKPKLEECERMLKNPYYSPEVKQTIYTSAIGILRRNGGAENREKMFRYLEEMRTLAPESIYGESYKGAMRLWGAWTVDWNPGIIPINNGPMEFKVPTIKSPGVYTVSFRFARGKHGFQCMAVELWDGDTKVTEDVHRCFAGGKHEGNEYSLTVPKAVTTPRLIIRTSMGNNRDSYGTISVKQD